MPRASSLLDATRGRRLVPWNGEGVSHRLLVARVYGRVAVFAHLGRVGREDQSVPASGHPGQALPARNGGTRETGREDDKPGRTDAVSTRRRGRSGGGGGGRDLLNLRCHVEATVEARPDDGEVRPLNRTERGQEVALDARVRAEDERVRELPAFDDRLSISAEKGCHPEILALGRPLGVLVRRRPCEDGGAALQEQNEKDGEHDDRETWTHDVFAVRALWVWVVIRDLTVVRPSNLYTEDGLVSELKLRRKA